MRLDAEAICESALTQGINTPLQLIPLTLEPLETLVSLARIHHLALCKQYE